MWNVVTCGRPRGTRAAARLPRPGDLGRLHRADADLVVAAGDEPLEPAADPRERPFDTGMPSCDRVRDLGELLVLGQPWRRTGAARSSWPAASTLTPKRSVSRTTGNVRARVVEADEQQQRVERERADGVGGHAHRTVGRAGGDHGDAGGEVAHHGAEAVGLDGVQRVVHLDHQGAATCRAPRGWRWRSRACRCRAPVWPTALPVWPGCSVVMESRSCTPSVTRSVCVVRPRSVAVNVTRPAGTRTFCGRDREVVERERDPAVVGGPAGVRGALPHAGEERDGQHEEGRSGEGIGCGIVPYAVRPR